MELFHGETTGGTGEGVETADETVAGTGVAEFAGGFVVVVEAFVVAFVETVEPLVVAFVEPFVEPFVETVSRAGRETSAGVVRSDV